MSRSRALPVVVALALVGCSAPGDIGPVTATTPARTTGQTSTSATTSTTPASPVAPPTTVEPAPEPAVPTTPVKTDVELAEAEVFDLTNAERARHGCPALAADDRLAAAARAHSADMAALDYFSHVSEDGRSFVDRVKAAGHPSPGAENIAAGQRTPRDVVTGWMESPGHRANILDCRLKALGVGLARGGSYGRYWTQNFGW